MVRLSFVLILGMADSTDCMQVSEIAFVMFDIFVCVVFFVAVYSSLHAKVMAVAIAMSRYYS